VLYVTEGGLKAKEAEIRELVNVKMKENATAIGRAAERGDLSENSEYRFALEERDLLRARLAQMNQQREVARVLTPDEVPTDHVGIGSRVTLRHNQTGQVREVRVLSPWEADAEKNILNYKAPLAQSLMGARCGDTVELTFTGAPGIYTVESLGNALLE
jgi:transcription elongation factor GreA